VITAPAGKNKKENAERQMNSTLCLETESLEEELPLAVWAVLRETSDPLPAIAAPD